MEFQEKQSLYRADGVSIAVFRRRSRGFHARAMLAAMGRAIAELYRTGRDHHVQLRMNDRQLRDIGLHRVDTALGSRIAPLNDGEW
ncbi:hypothetical protein [Hypericibacter sp.]|uniref:hypothetical protein n=1 Tax=Hypericibacter sp. TaxID=2705401 RepID=UPI003D6CB42F